MIVVVGECDRPSLRLWYQIYSALGLGNLFTQKEKNLCIPSSWQKFKTYEYERTMSPATCANYPDFIRCNKLSFHVYFKEDTDSHSLPWVAYHFATVSPYFLLTIGLVSFLSSIILPTMETTDIAAQVRSIYLKIRLHCRLIALFFFLNNCFLFVMFRDVSECSLFPIFVTLVISRYCLACNKKLFPVTHAILHYTILHWSIK